MISFIKDIDRYTILLKNASIREAIKKMDAGGIGFITCIDDQNVVRGILTDGDFRRAILNEIPLDAKIEKIMNRNFYSVKNDYSDEQIKNMFNSTVVKHIPVIEDGKLIDIITEENYFHIKKATGRNTLKCPVVIMAGGKGTRLDPFTRILPKPLIPIGEKAMIEVIMDEYRKNGMNDFYVTVNHKSRLIKAFFEDYDEDDRNNIQFIDEDRPLGTAGALRFLKNKISESFFVSNCDIIIHEDYSKIYEFHNKNKYDLTLVASMKNYMIPYGVCEIENGGTLKEIKEKPEYDLLVNTGMYVIEPHTLEHIPADELFHVTDLIKILQQKKYKIGVFPISENSWTDTGEWVEYNNALTKLLK